jgi:hypothetical protein
MRALKIFSITILLLLTLATLPQLLIHIVLVASVIVHQADYGRIGFAIGLFTGSLIAEILLVWGIVRLSKSLNRTHYHRDRPGT